MKRIIIFVLVFILIFVVGCSFKDDSNTDNSITTDVYNEEILDSVNSESVNIEQSNETDKIPLPIDFSQFHILLLEFHNNTSCVYVAQVDNFLCTFLHPPYMYNYFWNSI